MAKKPTHYKTPAGRILPATDVLHKMATKMLLVPHEVKTTPAPTAKTTAPRGRKPAAK